MHGEGEFARLLSKRFEVACRRFGYARRDGLSLDCTQFMPPRTPSPQWDLL
jgi:hypothetical protein